MSVVNCLVIKNPKRHKNNAACAGKAQKKFGCDKCDKAYSRYDHLLMA